MKQRDERGRKGKKEVEGAIVGREERDRDIVRESKG